MQTQGHTTLTTGCFMKVTKMHTAQNTTSLTNGLEKPDIYIEKNENQSSSFNSPPKLLPNGPRTSMEDPGL